jgi:hypothetical protein
LTHSLRDSAPRLPQSEGGGVTNITPFTAEDVEKIHTNSRKHTKCILISITMYMTILAGVMITAYVLWGDDDCQVAEVSHITRNPTFEEVRAFAEDEREATRTAFTVFGDGGRTIHFDVTRTKVVGVGRGDRRIGAWSNERDLLVVMDDPYEWGLWTFDGGEVWRGDMRMINASLSASETRDTVLSPFPFPHAPQPPQNVSMSRVVMTVTTTLANDPPP